MRFSITETLKIVQYGIYFDDILCSSKLMEHMEMGPWQMHMEMVKSWEMGVQVTEVSGVV